MRVLWILLVAGCIISCKKKSEYEVKYEVSSEVSGHIDTLIYINESGDRIMLTGADVPTSFSKKFKKKKGFHSYLYANGSISGTGTVKFLHRVTSDNDMNSYEMNKSFSYSGGIFTYKATGDYTLD